MLIFMVHLSTQSSKWISPDEAQTAQHTLRDPWMDTSTQIHYIWNHIDRVDQFKIMDIMMLIIAYMFWHFLNVF